MMRLGGQILDLILATCEKKLNEVRVVWANDHALTVVIATNGYPNKYIKGSKILGSDSIEEDSTKMLFHAGTKKDGEHIIANGGRVLNATARGSSIQEAKVKAYKMIEEINWKDGFYRKDIGWRAL